MARPCADGAGDVGLGALRVASASDCAERQVRGDGRRERAAGAVRVRACAIARRAQFVKRVAVEQQVDDVVARRACPPLTIDRARPQRRGSAAPPRARRRAMRSACRVSDFGLGDVRRDDQRARQQLRAQRRARRRRRAAGRRSWRPSPDRRRRSGSSSSSIAAATASTIAAVAEHAGLRRRAARCRRRPPRSAR